MLAMHNLWVIEKLIHSMFTKSPVIIKKHTLIQSYDKLQIITAKENALIKHYTMVTKAFFSIK